jgi:hypothetical protein
MSQVMLLFRTTRRLMYVIAGLAVLITIARSFRPASSHGYYFANRAVNCRRLERWMREQAALERAAAEEARHQRHVVGLDRKALLAAEKRHEAEAARWVTIADELASDAIEALKSSRTNGDLPWELPEFLRRELNPEDLVP